MEIFRFERAEQLVSTHGSTGVHATRIAGGAGPVHLTCLNVGPGGIIGTHPAPVPQTLLIIAGSGWIAGPDGERITITSGQGVHWDQGEEHMSGTDTGFTALAVEATALDLFKPAATPGG